MTWGLRIARFSLDGLYCHEDYGLNHSGLMIRCALPGWGQKAWFVARAASQARARNQHQQAHGQRILIYDAAGPVWQGWVMAVDIDGRWIRYEAAGTYQVRMRDDWYSPTIDVSDTVSDFMQVMLTAVAPAVYVNAANFASNATEIGDVFVQAVEEGEGLLAADVIPALLAMRDSSYNLYDFWLQPRRWANARPQYDAAHYVQRVKTRVRADWYVRQNDLVESDRQQHSHIYDYSDSATVAYGHVTGTSSVPAPPTYYLYDPTVNFHALGVTVGDMATDLTRSAGGAPVYMYVAGISEDGHTLTGGSGYNWYTGAVGHDYRIKLQQLGNVTVTASGTTNLWSSVGQIFEAPELDQTQASQLAAELAATYSNPVYQEPFTIGGRFVRDTNGGRWPLWSLLRKPGYMVQLDRYEYDTSGNEIDIINRRGLFTSALDYNHDERTITVTPNEPSDRLDVRLQAFGIVDGQTIESGRGGIDPVAQSYIDSFRRRGGGNAPLIFYDWRFGPPPPNWEEQMRAQGLNPQLGPNPEGMYRNG